MKIRLIGSNMSSSSSATYNLNAIEIGTREVSPAPAYGSWSTVASFDTSCGGISLTGRLQVCCGSCTTVTPVMGYPPVAPGTPAGFGDEGPELVWMTDEVDLSAWAGAGSCTAKLLGSGASASSQAGWVVDSMTVRMR